MVEPASSPLSEKKMERILIVEDDRELGRFLCEELEDAGYHVKNVDSAEEAAAELHAWMPDLVISDLKLPGADGMALLEWTRELHAQPGFLIITAFGSIPQAVEALKSGADDFLAKPLDLEHLRLSTERILRHRRLKQEVRRFKELMARDAFYGMIGRSRKIRVMFNQLREIAAAQGPALIQGESGVGKELVAKALHDLSPRCKAPFLAVNCAGIPAELLESEFFGHEEGAFTGAVKKRQGLFQQTHQGSLLLDEIGEMPYNLQSKLLRVLQDGTFRPVGGNREQQVDVRIICATNQNLENLMNAGAFRQDLFYRLETFSIRVPPLRERKDDIPLLAAHFLNRFCLQMGKEIKGLTPEALEQLTDYSFPGNVRELQNIIERAVTFCHGSHLDVEHLPTRIRSCVNADIDETVDASERGTLDDLLTGHELMPSLAEIEKQYITRVLERVGGNKRRAAAILGVSRRTLYRHLMNS
ncbi:MAG: mutant NtrC activator [delta proteobacterium MLS_D]|jgi:two-component system, NtrC family, response regulator AtoC|nr:MAG: mutant NtrC activator [delta proteobacterium MLS_D]